MITVSNIPALINTIGENTTVFFHDNLFWYGKCQLELFNRNEDLYDHMDSHELTTLLHELISEQNKCDSELYFDKNTNFDKRDIVMKKILDLNNASQVKA